MTVIDGIEYDSPYNVHFFKREDGKVIMNGLKIGDVISFGERNHENTGKIIGITAKSIEIDDGSGLEIHCRLQYDKVSDTKIYATFQKIPN